MKKEHGIKHGITLKKKYGQHFLNDQNIIDIMLNNVALDTNSSVFEIGCGDGFLTKSILQKNIARLWVFEIDPHWAKFVKEKYNDSRLVMYELNFLDLDFSIFNEHKPWILLANLPYNVSFPILKRLHENRRILQEGVIMLQEEVAQRIVAKSGRDYGYVSLFFQHYFDWKLLNKISPNSFYPPPNVYSRLLHFLPKFPHEIKNEEQFWIFIKRCFARPRRTLKNNLSSYHYNLTLISEDILKLRAQQMTKEQLLEIWAKL